MEHNLSLSVAFATKAQRDFCRLLLSDNIDRPLFEDDVPQDRRPWFRAIDEVDVPDSVKGSGPLRLHLTWLVGGYSWEQDLLANMARFAAIGGHGCYALAIREVGDTTPQAMMIRISPADSNNCMGCSCEKVERFAQKAIESSWRR